VTRQRGRSGNEYFIAKILAPCPFEFAKIDGIWYRRKKYKRKEVPWEEIVFSENSAALDKGELI
jgi:hypothetical protein